tara:strand:+ start:142 stop:1857 length:1716 start_codon:yes stop_codon:yes gene_type:complete
MSSFLTFTTKHIRKSIQDIDSSYNHDWDILAELAQNSIDALRLHGNDDPKITIHFNRRDNSIRFIDNGCGIKQSDLLDLLVPFSTNKDEDNATIGEKGVGLSFGIFSSNYFEINTGDKNGKSRVVLKDARVWKEGTTNELIDVHEKEFSDQAFDGTDIILKDLGDLSIFDLSLEQLIYLLRTKTAIGCTKTLFDDQDQFNLKVKLFYIDPEGGESEEDIPYKYFLIEELLNDDQMINIKTFKDWMTSGDRSDSDKRRKIANKLIIEKSNINGPRGNIPYYFCMVPKRSIWDDYSIDAKLCNQEDLDNEQWKAEKGYLNFSGGITVSVKGMPTGIQIAPPQVGWSGYFPNTLIIMEDDALKFDIGRKSLHGSTSNRLKNYAKDIFNNNVVNLLAKYITGDVQIDQERSREQHFNEIRNQLELQFDNQITTKFKKTPKDQEATVAAIFYEQIGTGVIKNINPLSSGYKNQYDLYAETDDGMTLVIEFKSKLSHIIKDFNNIVKYFEDMNCIVCWDVDEIDKQKLLDENVRVEEITSGIENTNSIIPNATHELLIPQVRGIKVIDLKKIVSLEA